MIFKLKKIKEDKFLWNKHVPKYKGLPTWEPNDNFI